MLKRILVTTIAAAVVAGCSGEDKTFKPKSLISGVEPNFIASGRTRQVEIHGDFTKWEQGAITEADVSFGDGLTVDSVQVGNEGFLLVTLIADADAALGSRDVTVDGELLAGVFQVRPPFEISNATVIQGDYAVLDIIGHETDWLDGRTEVVFDGDGIYQDGDDNFSIAFTEVVSESFIQAFVHVDPFAAPGPRTVTINGLSRTDSRPEALTVEAATFTTLTAGTTNLEIENGGGLAAKVRIPAGAVDTLERVLVVAGVDNLPFGVLYDPDTERQVSGVMGGDTFEAVNSLAGKELYAWFWDANWLSEALAGNVITDGPALPFDLVYDGFTASALTVDTPDTANTWPAAGELALYKSTAADRWNLVTASVSNVAVDLNASLRAHRQGVAQSVAPVSGTADSGVEGDGESLTFLAGGGLDALLVVEDVNDSESGAGTEHDIVFSETAVAGTLYEANDVNLAIPEEGQLESTITVAGGTAAITAVHVLVDLDHTWRGDLVLELESPSGTVVTLYDLPGDPEDGLIEAFPDTLDPADTNGGDLADFEIESADGDWILRIVDQEAPDAGTLRGWALAIEGV